MNLAPAKRLAARAIRGHHPRAAGLRSLFTPAAGMMKLETRAGSPVRRLLQHALNPRTAPHRLSRMRLHHPRAQPAPAGAPAARSPAATRAATRRRPRRICRELRRRRQLRATTPRRSTIRAVDAVVVAVPPRFHLDLTLAGARRRQARAGREAGVPAHGRLPRRCSTRATAPARVVLVGENDHYKPLAVTLRAAARRRRRSARWCSRTSRRSPSG